MHSSNYRMLPLSCTLCPVPLGVAVLLCRCEVMPLWVHVNTIVTMSEKVMNIKSILCDDVNTYTTKRKIKQRLIYISCMTVFCEGKLCE